MAEQSFYQMLMALDENNAIEIAEKCLGEKLNERTGVFAKEHIWDCKQCRPVVQKRIDDLYQTMPHLDKDKLGPQPV
jgi:hypothetical protein